MKKENKQNQLEKNLNYHLQKNPKIVIDFINELFNDYLKKIKIINERIRPL